MKRNEEAIDRLLDDNYIYSEDYINFLTKLCHQLAVENGWWHDIETGQRKERNVGELIALCHSELSEALEGFRKNLQDNHLPHMKSAEVELADALIRIFDLAGGFGLDLGKAFAEKLAYNSVRPDHKIEERLLENGKKF